MQKSNIHKKSSRPKPIAVNRIFLPLQGDVTPRYAVQRMESAEKRQNILWRKQKKPPKAVLYLFAEVVATRLPCVVG